jgi:PAS domain-containing protein
MEGAVVLTLTAVSVCVGGALGYFAWERCDVPGARSYTVHVLVHALWGLSYGLELVSESAATMALANAFVTVWSTTAAVSWLVFVLDYTGRTAWLKPRRLALLLAEPIAYIALYVTNSRHGLVYSGSTIERTAGLSYVSIEGTALLYGQILIIYLILSIGFALLGAFILRSRNLYRKQTTTIFLGALVFVIGNLVWVATVGEGYGLDLTHLFFIGNGVVIGWALFHHEFLDGAPLASDVLIEEMDDPVVVVDDDDQRLIDYNEAAEAAFDLEASPHGARVGGRLAEVVEASEGPVRVGDGPAATDGGAATVYQPKRTRLSDQHDIVRGELLVLRDVTAQQRREAKLEALQEGTHELMAAESKADVAAATTSNARSVLGYPFAGVLLYDEDREELVSASLSAPTELALNDPKMRIVVRDCRGKLPAEPAIERFTRRGPAVALLRGGRRWRRLSCPIRCPC